VTRVLVMGHAPLPWEDLERSYGPGTRTWQFASTLLADGHEVVICASRIPFVYPEDMDPVMRSEEHGCVIYRVEQTALEVGAYAAELMKTNPSHVTDWSQIARLRRIGIEQGKSFDFEKADPVVQRALEKALTEGLAAMKAKAPTLARVVNGWQMNTNTMGVYGDYYLKRAIVTQVGLGANLPEDAIYPLNLADQAGKPLDGANKYTIHFAKDEIPPVDAFWSITLYDPEGFQVANSINRFAVSSWMPFKRDADGSLTLYFQNESPGGDRESNWLPAPKGPFNLTMRLYAPKSEALTGKWNPPPVTMTHERSSRGSKIKRKT